MASLIKCPACGAVVDPLALKCPECGYILSQESESGKLIRDSIESLQSQLSQERNPSKQASIINGFSMPGTVEGLLNLLVFSYSRFEQSNGLDDEKISVDHKGTIPKVKASREQRKRRSWTRWIIILGIIAIVVYLFLLILSNMDEPVESDVSVRQQVMELVQEGKYDEARKKTSEMEYSWDQRELMEMIEKEENK